jgi:hypothetical protein
MRETSQGDHLSRKVSMRRLLLTALGLALGSSVAATELPGSVSLTQLPPSVENSIVSEECARCLMIQWDDEPPYGECEPAPGSRTICWEMHDPEWDIFTCDTIELFPWQECEGSHHEEDENSVTDVTDAEVVYAPEGAIIATARPCATGESTHQS